MSDALDEPVNPESFELARDLTRRQVRQFFLDIEMPKTGDEVLAADKSEEQIPVVVAEEVEALVGALAAAFGFAYLVEVLGADGGVFESADELEVAMIRGADELS